MNTSHQAQSYDENSEVLSGSESGKGSSRPPLSESDSPAVRLRDELIAPTGQMCLFPLAPGSPGRITLLDHPCRGLSAAITLIEWRHNFFSHIDSDKCWLRYLAVTEDRTFLVTGATTFFWTELQDIDFLEMFWDTLVTDIAKKRENHIPLPDDWSFQVPEDCLDSLLDPQTWRSCSGGDPVPPSARATVTLVGNPRATIQRCLELEAEAERQFAERLNSAVMHVVAKLPPAIRDVFVARPPLGFSSINRVLTVAKAINSPAAVRYAVQVLEDQSLCLIDHLCKESQVLQLQSSLSGGSVPRMASGLGFSPGVYRRSVRHAGVKRASPLLDFPISPGNLLALLPLAKTLPFSMWPKCEEECQQFFDSLFLLHDLLMPMEELSSVLRWCVQDGYRDGYPRVVLLYEKWLALSSTGNLAGFDNMLEPGAFFSLAFSFVKNSRKGLQMSEIAELLDANDVVGNVMAVAEYLGKSVDELTAAIMSKHPDIPIGFSWKPYKVISLTTVASARKHGIACGICIENEAQVVEYVAGGVALFGIYGSTGECLGTVGLVLDDSTDPPHVQIWQVTGVANDDVPPVLQALAEALARSSGDDIIARARWFDYANACTEFCATASLAR